jgi:hypothetical protein
MVEEKDEALLKTVEQLEQAVNRYMGAEKVIADYLQAPWYKRIFFSKIFLKYLISNLKQR